MRRRLAAAIVRRLNDRAQDNWEPLFAVASLAGGHWPARVDAAAISYRAPQIATPAL
ncbi:MAG: DUF3631 domain-containing protein [Acetobacteraceae bacterium]|nr:DUF3631 domain-containing protein [Acetobacteraceae bacterium]